MIQEVTNGYVNKPAARWAFGGYHIPSICMPGPPRGSTTTWYSYDIKRGFWTLCSHGVAYAAHTTVWDVWGCVDLFSVTNAGYQLGIARGTDIEIRTEYTPSEFAE